jgi:hypothetical protein
MKNNKREREGGKMRKQKKVIYLYKKRHFSKDIASVRQQKKRQVGRHKKFSFSTITLESVIE